MKIYADNFKPWIRRASLTGGIAVAAAGAGAAVAASASHAQCTAAAPACGHGQTQPSQSGATHPEGGGSTNSRRHADPQAGILPLGARATPILNRRVILDGGSGTVLVKAPGGSSFVALGRGASVPVGSTVNATKGAVTLTSVKDAGGTVQHGRFWGATFRVTQTGGAHPSTVLTLVDGSASCPATHSRAALTAARSRSRLWGRDSHGRFSTRGHYGVASVRGTEWVTQDVCGATRFQVARGAIVVHDFRRHRNVTVTAGHTYSAHK
jgi:hypothetical protein